MVASPNERTASHFPKKKKRKGGKNDIMKSEGDAVGLETFSCRAATASLSGNHFAQKLTRETTQPLVPV